MADNNIKFIINVDDSGSKATIRDINGQILKTNVSVKDLNVAFKDVSKTLGLNDNALSSNAKYHKNSEKAIRSEIDSLQSLRSTLDVNSKGYEYLGNRISLLQQKLKTTSSGIDGLSKAQQQLKNSSGAASSAAMELGRVISDAPYGIRGMANNLTQLVSQLGFATTAAGGFKAAMKQMWTALMGPLGVVLAITTAISALDYFAGSQQKAKKETDENTKSLKKQIKPLEKLINLYSSLRGILFTSKDNEAINAFNNNMLSLDETVSVLTRNFSEFKNAYDKLSDDDKKNKDSVKTLLDSYSKLLKLRELEEKQVARMSVLRDDVDKKGRTISRNGLTFLRAEAKELDNLEKAYIDTQKELIKLDKHFSKKDKEEDEKVDKKDAASVLLDLYGIDISDEAHKEYIDKLTEMFDFSGADFDLSVAPKLNMELSDETQAGIDAYNKGVVDLMSEKFKAEDFAKYADTAKKALSNISNFIDAQFDRQLVTENNRTNAMNEELNNRLLNENLSAKERANIQNQIAQNDEKLRVKQNEIKKKAFNTNKAFQLAMAVADTSSSVLKAYGSQLVIGDPTSLFRAKIAASIAGAMGALQIATIASSKFQPDAASTPIRTSSGGSAGGGGNNRTFDFNLVGNNQNNQLAQAIGGQFEKPIKAYVVSKDITNQQQLDANTKSTARFGG